MVHGPVSVPCRRGGQISVSQLTAKKSRAQATPARSKNQNDEKVQVASSIPFRRVSLGNTGRVAVAVVVLTFSHVSMAASAAAINSYASVSGIPRIMDGDTVEVSGKRVRLLGIDAPELKQFCTNTSTMSNFPCGAIAKNALVQKVGTFPMVCAVQEKTDVFGRLLGYCGIRVNASTLASRPASSLNAWMVRSGNALAYRQYSTAFIDQEEAAKKSKQGLWAKNVKFEEPWEWRKSQRSPQPGDSNCLIKGNISSRGEKIYHLPGSQYYDSVKINTSKGEKYFCTEQEAQSEGWRPVKG